MSVCADLCLIPMFPLLSPCNRVCDVIDNINRRWM